MFAPDGFALFHEIETRIHELVSEAYPFFGPHGLPAVIQMRREGRHEVLAEFSRNCRSLSVASPSGNILRISPLILWQCDFPVLGQHFVYLDADTGLVDTAQTERLASWASQQLIPLRSQIDANPDLQSELEGEMTEYQKAEEAARYIKVFSKFNGWAVVCKLEHLPKSITEFSSLTDAFSSSKGGSPSEQQIIEALVSLVDQGQHPKREEFRLDVCPAMKREEFRAIWSHAARMRPTLSRPGPKPLK